MNLDVTCGELGFLDLTFEGLDAIPGPGEERHAAALLRSPGGGATTAIACARLGLRAALASPLGDDAAGAQVREALAADGVQHTGRTVDRTAVTVVLPARGERAMATVDPGEAVTAEELAIGDPRAVIVSLPRLARAPAGARVYATAGDAEARAASAAQLRPDLVYAGAETVLVNAHEAALLTLIADPTEAARALAEHVPCAVVTRGADGAVACADGTVVAVPGVPAHAVDTTGAGDVFAAAYVWADLAGAPLEQRLRWATLYAARSTEVPTAVGGALGLEALARAGEHAGLAPITPVLKEDTR